MTNLLEREIEVLKIIIEDYIEHAQPVGSRTVSKQSALKLSAASMRNVMADLTDKGFLEQPHTSAGRVPTALAFRHYLDTNLETNPISEEERQRINDTLENAGLELHDILNQATRLVSSYSQQVGMVLAPNQEDVRWREIGFILVKSGRPSMIMTVLILDGGIVQNRLVELDEEISADELIKFSNYLNDNFQGMTLSEVRYRILLDLEDEKDRLKQLYRSALNLARSTFEKSEERRLFVDGTLHILEAAGQNQFTKMRDILLLIEERSRLLELLDQTIMEQGVRIILGDESDVESLDQCGVISSSYGPNSPLGVVSVIGPIRMNYAKVIPVVDYISKKLTSLLKTRF